MITHLPEPERWVDRRAQRSSAEDLLGGALRGARAATTPPERLLARVEAHLAASNRAETRHPHGRVAVAALIVMLAVGGVAGVASGRLGAWAARHRLRAVAPRSAPAEARPAQSRRTEGVLAAEAPGAGTEARRPALALPVASASIGRPAAARSTLGARVATTAARAAEEPSRALEEARLLQRAFRALRAEGQAGAALAALDEHDLQFPAGLLRGEAALARIEALLALGQRPEALARLDAWEADANLPRTMLLARGELRADAGRCAEASQDFAAALASSAEDEVGGRALYGRASCALRAGDDATAIELLTRYLEVHSAGPMAVAARDALARLAGKAAPASP